MSDTTATHKTCDKDLILILLSFCYLCSIYAPSGHIVQRYELKSKLNKSHPKTPRPNITRCKWAVIDFAPQGYRLASLVFHCVGSAMYYNKTPPSADHKKQREDFVKLQSSLLFCVLYEQFHLSHCSLTPCDPVGGSDLCCVAQTHKALWLLCHHALTRHSQRHRCEFELF